MIRIMLTFLALLTVIMSGTDSTITVEKFSGTPLPAGHHMDPANLIKSIQPSSIVGCSSACKKEAACLVFSMAGTACMLFNRASVIADANAIATSFFETAPILLVRHDYRGGEFFPAHTGSWALNKDDVNARLFSRLDELDNYIGSDGTYNFKLCYPELNLGDNCYYFDQTTDPRLPSSNTVISGFQLVSVPSGQPGSWPSQPFLGLGSNLAYPGTAWLDGSLGENHWFAVGALRTHGTTGEFPGILDSSTLHTANIVELYIIPT